MRQRSVVLCILCCLLSALSVEAYRQDAKPDKEQSPTDSSARVLNGMVHQLDFIDIGLAIIKRQSLRKPDSFEHQKGKVYASPIPAIGYSLQTGFEVSIVCNLAFYNSTSADANINSIMSSVNYTQYHQFLLPIQANLWTNNNTYNIQTDWHYVKFPQATYGLGGYTKLSDEYTIDFSNLRLYTTVFKAIKKDMFLGLGYYFDYIWNSREVNPPAGIVTDFQKYGVVPTSYVSGLSISYQYDNRRNSINPEGGSLVNLVFRPNLKIMGSSDNWESLVLDMRKYIPLPFGSKNVLAFWSYNWFTFFNGLPPYISLPNTGGDPYGNTGRGYNEGRFRGRNMLYAEGEYRFAISRNGFVGGVIFANAQSFTEMDTHQFALIHPGYGAGLRFKFNKFSRTNVAVDYGFGNDGSKGLFLNLGEIF